MPSRFPKSWPALTALLLLGSLVWVLLPGMVIVLDDDFWYLRSVIKTFQKSRPWTDDWLTPWAASASSLSALLFRVTGSFTFAIHFQLAAAAGLAAAGAHLFLKHQGLPTLPSLAAALLILATPTFLFMFLMFTGVALYMACLWWCLLLADRRQWLWFLVPWGLAVANRQSAVVWLALPGWALLTEAWTQRTWRPPSPGAKRIWLTFGAAAAIFLACKLGMNPTEGQKLVVGSLHTSGFSLDSAISPMLALLAFLAGMGLSSLLRLRHILSSRPLPAGWRVRLAVMPVLAAAGAWGALWCRTWTIQTHDCYNNTFTGTLLPCLGAVLGAALALAAPRPRAGACMAALGSGVLLFLYKGRFDYYFVEPLCFGLAAAFPILKCDHTSPVTVPAPRWIRAAATGLILLIAGGTVIWHTRSAVRLKVQQDRGAAIIELYEGAIRSGKLAPENTGMATFGYLGWLFQDYYSANDGKTDPVLGGFCRYAQDWNEGRGTGILTHLPKPLRPWRELIPSRNRTTLRDARDVPVLMEIERPLLGRYPVRYNLLRGPSPDRVPGTLTLNPAAYQRIPFPLNDEEWRHLILKSPPLP